MVQAYWWRKWEGPRKEGEMKGRWKNGRTANKTAITRVEKSANGIGKKEEEDKVLRRALLFFSASPETADDFSSFPI